MSRIIFIRLVGRYFRAVWLGATLKAGQSATYSLGEGRHAYLSATSGELEVNGVRLQARDGAAVADEPRLEVRALSDAEVVLVDSP